MNLKPVWESAKKDEVYFWELWLPGNYEWYARPTKLRDYFKEFIGDRKKVKILDVGSGPVSTIGYTWDNTDVELILTDALAREYSQLFKKLKIKPVLPVIYQDMTHLTYKNDVFDIVHCRNALDHTVDPIAAVKEMVRVCKPGGWVYLSHFSRVGKKSRYKGFHQWNIDAYGEGDCVIWNNDQSFLLSNILTGFTTEVGRKKDGVTTGVTVKYQRI